MVFVPVKILSRSKITEDVFVLVEMSVENNNSRKLTLKSDKFNYVNEEHGFVSSFYSCVCSHRVNRVLAIVMPAARYLST